MSPHDPARPAGPARDVAVVGGTLVELTPDWRGQRRPGTVLVRDGRIAAVGPGVPVPAGVPVLDATGRLVLPGFVDAHTHLGVHAEGEGWHGADVNEKGEPRGARLRSWDGVDPADRGFLDALSAGVTTVAVLPGSANVVGGQTAALRTWGTTVEQMLLRAPIGVKSALGENPRKNGQSSGGPTTRMGIAASLRDSFAAAQRFTARRERARAGGEPLDPPTDRERDAEVLARVLAGEIVWQQHAHRADDIATAVRLADEFGYRLVLNHVTEGHRVLDLLVERGLPAVVGPLLTSRSKPELRHRSMAVPGLLAAAGLRVALTTDHPVVPIQLLPVSAALAVKEGLDPDEALRALTLNPAVILGIDDRVGSLAPGLDGDVVVWSGDPLEVASRALHVVSGGRPVYRWDGTGEVLAPDGTWRAL
ncbi:imidazolonepropionase-like amidohydrolase [Kineococcus radiotolerans]|uniref:Imidazolonepropionase-like amidohydrolase n=1 Tax=Kineococcus radiotolerans TaxID=131568 RepID=A0A7W4TN36_KINRA|nr:amidohydrolase [Kineococcus radiotolerans]MBB2901974.1 imidazolonepropionase-like amidohydrolase [Kineococcus radiotolerans]